VAGTVANSSTNVIVTAVGGGATQPAGRAAGFWGAEVLPNNSGVPVKQTINVIAADPGQGSGGADLVSTDSVTTPVAPDSETHTYDEDGNLLTDGLYSYEWDAENRLAAMQTNATQIWSGVNRRRYEHKYDYLNRRVQSSTQVNVGSWIEIRSSTFYYEGWNLIREKISDMDLGTTFYRTYAWGLDIVGSLSSSGGVQGLIDMRDTYEAKTYLPGYDANGNVAVMLDAADGSIEAAYEYGPFGEYLRKEGDYADENPIRFSTKYTDEDTNLVYYGRRYYDPKDGRFVGRDPLQEAGGMNLYAFVANSSVNRWDYLGMNWWEMSEAEWEDADEDRRYDPTDFASGLSSFGEKDPWVARELNLFGANNFDIRRHDNRDLSGSGSGDDLLTLMVNVIINTVVTVATTISTPLKIGGSILGSGNLGVLNPFRSEFAGYQVAGGAIATAGLAAGLPVSFATGDIMDSYQTITDGSQIHVNGINTSAAKGLGDAKASNLSYSENDSHFFGLGDLVQVVAESLGVITTPSIYLSQSIANGSNDLILHSQGTAVGANAIRLIPRSGRSEISVTGVGGQFNINAGHYGIGSSTNIVAEGDPIPYFHLGNVFNRAFPTTGTSNMRVPGQEEGLDMKNHAFVPNYLPHIPKGPNGPG